MRLLIKLRCVESSEYEMQYHYHLQGVIYKLLKGSKYHYLHNKGGYKFFCFSNIFPATKNLERGDLRTLIISSPDDGFITYLYEVLKQLNNHIVNIGCMNFGINYVDKVITNLPNNSSFTLITGTPILVRIPREKFKAYGVELSKNYDYIYWRSEHPINLFVSQVEDNLLKKINEYSRYGCNCVHLARYKDTTSPSHPVSLQKFKLKKQISTRIFMKGFDQVVIGTTWELGFNMDTSRDVIRFALDCGLGERNSLGFGFMNVLTNK